MRQKKNQNEKKMSWQEYDLLLDSITQWHPWNRGHVDRRATDEDDDQHEKAASSSATWNSLSLKGGKQQQQQQQQQVQVASNTKHEKTMESRSRKAKDSGYSGGTKCGKT